MEILLLLLIQREKYKVIYLMIVRLCIWLREGTRNIGLILLKNKYWLRILFIRRVKGRKVQRKRK